MTPDDFSSRWFYKAGATKLGPVSTAELHGMLQRQTLTAESAVWRDGMESWLPAREVGELFPEGGVLPAGGGDASDTYARRPAWTRSLIIGCAGLAVSGLVLAKLSPREDGDPYTYRRVSGTTLYEDGQVIPAEVLTLTFIPLVPPQSPRIHPRPGFALVDPKTGAFQSTTSRKPGDGLVKGGHKVLISGDNRLPLPDDIVPLEYADFKTTPLEVDTKTGTFHLKVKRPAPTAKRADSKPQKAAPP